MRALLEKTRLCAWGLGQAVRLGGRPDVALGFLGGIGDDLLCTAAIDEHLRRGARHIWFITRHPSLYTYDQRVRLVPEDCRFLKLAERLGRPMRPLSYSRHEPVEDRDTPCREHLIAIMCRHAGLSGRIWLRPHLSLPSEDLDAARSFENCLVLQSGGLDASVPMRNKQWPAERMHEVAVRLGGGFRLVQIGSRTDPALPGVVDLRGRTTLRETAAILARARLFVGGVGFPMHLARAVNCPAVIVYGGREPPEISGYPCNVNLVRRPPCSPCWRRNTCDHERVCLEDIPASEVLAGVDQQLAASRDDLAVEEVHL